MLICEYLSTYLWNISESSQSILGLNLALEAIAVKSATPEKSDQQTLKILEKTNHKMDSATWLKRKIRRVMRSVTALEEKVDINDHGIESNKVKSVASYNNLAVEIHFWNRKKKYKLWNLAWPKDRQQNYRLIWLKVSKFRKQIMVTKLLPKHKPSSLSWKITTSRLIQKRVSSCKKNIDSLFY